jgi:hypothetical protein
LNDFEKFKSSKGEEKNKELNWLILEKKNIQQKLLDINKYIIDTINIVVEFWSLEYNLNYIEDIHSYH